MGDGMVTFTVTAPGDLDTRATTIADGKNVDELHWAVYKTKPGEDYAIDDSGEIDGPLAKGIVPMSNKTATLELDLLQDQYYTILFWAQVAGAGHYNVGDLREVTVNYDVVQIDGEDVNTIKANDESRAAFFLRHDFNTSTQQNYNVTLVRPFAQINLGTTLASLKPVQQGQKLGYEIKVEKSEMSVKGIASSFSLVTGEGKKEAVDFTFTANSTPAKADEQLFVNDTEYHYVGMNYLVIPVLDETVQVSYEITTDKGNITNTIENVPVKENYRTNIIGNLLTSKTEFNIIVDERFEVPDYIVDPTVANPVDASDVADAIANPDVTVINLSCDINESAFVIDVDAPVKELTVNMNDYPISNGDADGSYDFNILNKSTVIFNDANFPQAGGMIQAAYGATVIFNGGVSNISSSTTSQRYNFYAASPGTTITINEGTFSFEAYKQRSYACALNGAVIYIKGGTFGVAPNHPRWKTPIYTDATGQVIITGGTFGFDPSAWVAPGYQAVKSGSTWTVEQI